MKEVDGKTIPIVYASIVYNTYYMNRGDKLQQEFCHFVQRARHMGIHKIYTNIEPPPYVWKNYDVRVLKKLWGAGGVRTWTIKIQDFL